MCHWDCGAAALESHVQGTGGIFIPTLYLVLGFRHCTENLVHMCLLLCCKGRIILSYPLRVSGWA